MVDGAALAGVLQQHQLQRRLGDGEVGVALLDLGGLGVEQLGVERDRLVEIVDVEGELDTGHDDLRMLDIYRTDAAAQHATFLIYVNVSGRMDACPRHFR